jgi:hypothetical protein
MATEYIIFIHGVNTRCKKLFEEDARNMFERIVAQIPSNSSRTFKPVTLFWGDIAEESIELLNRGLDASPTWPEFWFQNFRKNQVFPFVGDAALYLSRGVSVEIIKRLTEQAIGQMGIKLDTEETIATGDAEAAISLDRIHLVTHSWGTVILFDIMFASRWESADLSDDIRKQVEEIRRAFFGIGNPEIKNEGLPIASIHTMGSPIALFNLLNASGAQSFNLTPKLKEFLSALYDVTGEALPWRNYANPGDPIAYPLKGTMDLSLDEAKNFVDIVDIMMPRNPIMSAIGKTPASILFLLSGGEAHGSYWKDGSTIQKIAATIAAA